MPEPLALLAERWPVLIAALVASAFATATAVGGGFLFLPLFVLVYGLAPGMSLRLSLSTQAFGMTSGALAWRRVGFDWPALRTALAAGGAGLLLGLLVLVPDAGTVKTAFGVLSVVVGLAALAELRLGRSGEPRPPGRLDTALLALLCLAAGLATAWTSIGLGGVVALWLVHRLGSRPDRAIATGAAALAAMSVASFALFAARGEVPWDWLVFTAPGVVVGGRLGAVLGRRLEERWRLVGRRPAGWRGYSPLKAVFVGVVLANGLAMLALS